MSPDTRCPECGWPIPTGSCGRCANEARELRAYNANHCPACSDFRPCGASWVTPAEVIRQRHNESVMDSSGCYICQTDNPAAAEEGCQACESEYWDAEIARIARARLVSNPDCYCGLRCFRGRGCHITHPEENKR